MALGKINKRSRAFVLPKLQITSMMDMFTIILIFLLFSFSDNPEDIALEKNLELPVSNAKMDYTDNIRLVISRDNLKIGESVIAKVKNGKVVGLNPKKLDQSALYKRLKQENLKIESYEETSSSENSNSETIGSENNAKKNHILFLCDKQLSFKTINSIIKTAGMAGFPNFQFAVLKE